MRRPSVDFHTHILPEVDDGSKSVEMSLQMLREEQKSGIKTVVATPHFYPNADLYEDFQERRKNALEKLKEAAKGEELPNIILGAEVFYAEGIENWDILSELAIEGTKFILIEIPHTGFTERHLKGLSKFEDRTGYTPIVAHLDRYMKFFNTHGLPEKLAEMELLVQVNASYFLDFPDRLQALSLLKQDKIHLLGSDCHNLTYRSPNLNLAYDIIEQKLGKEAISKFTEYEDLVFGR